ncbi:peptidyl-prolyl cis-trans isomerase FKBP8-like [Gigantopelta aegis]|uniref:peptidyl-prolyl cis-trans isomerase FKBP8-like n=1 Tax=Gigantopelta aegis TaxID=1735272 RepID=UPI001B88D2EE|nr:peptidyl-prolyl cis-trans isomerase FKBP8-like [Gigantopelta aegis]
MDHKSEDLLQGEGQTEMNNQSDNSLLDENQSAINDSRSKMHLSQDEQPDSPTFPSVPATADISAKIPFSKEFVGGEVNDSEVNSSNADSFTENRSIAGGGDDDDSNVSNSVNVENIGSITTQTESTELSIPEQNNETNNKNVPEKQTELENSKISSDEITTDVRTENARENNDTLNSDLIDDNAVPEELSNKAGSVVNTTSESMMDKELPKFDEVSKDIGVEKNSNSNAQESYHDSRTEDASMNGVNEQGEDGLDESQNAENTSTESTQNEDSTTATTEEKTDPTEEKSDPIDEWMDILGNGLLKKKVLKSGEGRSSRPKAGETVFLKTEGKLDDGTVIDKFESVSFILGDGDVIQAWDLAVSLMDMGEICELVTHCKYAYGSVGRDNIPGDAAIIYTLELVKKEPGLDLDSMSVEERTQKGEAKRERGNHLFSRKEFQAAINSYTKALRILEHQASTHNVDPDALKNLSNSQIKCYNNLAACQLKIEAYDAAIKSSNKVLSNEPDNVKALFRIGKSYSCKGDCENAEPYLRKALSLDPQSKMLHRELAWVTRKIKQDSASQKEMYRRMMGVDKNTPKKKQNKWWKMPLVIGSIIAGTLAVLGAIYRTSQH